MQDGLRNIHSSMIQRCENPKRPQYIRYGGRGIKVCEEWHNYETFRKWALENGYKHPLKLDRIDNIMTSVFIKMQIADMRNIKNEHNR